MQVTPYNAVMLDLECMSTDSNASIIAIGAVKFWLNVKQTEFTDDQLFYTSVSLSSSQEAGLHIKADTVMWWLGQDDQARSAFKNPVTLASALNAFSRFVPGKRYLHLWQMARPTTMWCCTMPTKLSISNIL